MPQLMPLCWLMSSCMVLMLMFMFMNIYMYKNEEKFNLMFNVNNESYNYLW